jgi:hypothetical protein
MFVMEMAGLKPRMPTVMAYVMAMKSWAVKMLKLATTTHLQPMRELASSQLRLARFVMEMAGLKPKMPTAMAFVMRTKVLVVPIAQHAILETLRIQTTPLVCMPTQMLARPAISMGA